MVCSLPGSSVHGIFQIRKLEWVAISFSRGSSWPRNWAPVSSIQADSLPTELWGKPKEANHLYISRNIIKEHLYIIKEVSNLYIYIYSFSLGAPLSPFYSSRSPQSTALSNLCYIAGSHQLFILHDDVYVSLNLPIHPIVPSTSTPQPNFHGQQQPRLLWNWLVIILA